MRNQSKFCAVLAVGALTVAGMSSALKDNCESGAAMCRTPALEKEHRLLQVETQKRVVPELPEPYSVRDAGQTTSKVGTLLQTDVSQTDSPSEAELQHFQMVKDLRTRGYSCKSKSFPGNPDTERTFKFDCRLWRAARLWSSQMGEEKFFAHARGGSDPCSRTKSFGLTACGENIAAGSSSPEEALKQWKDSDGHCTNMMDPRYNRFAVGYVMTPRSPYTHYWTQSLGNDFEPADESCLPGRVAMTPETTAPEAPADTVREPGWSGRGSGVTPDATEPEAPVDTTEPVREPGWSGRGSGGVSWGQPGRVDESSGGDNSARSGEASGGRDSGPRGGDSQCEDGDNHCAEHYKDFCHLDHVVKLCPKTCNKCCKDTSAHCTTHYSNMCNLDTVKGVCPKSCGLCSR